MRANVVRFQPYWQNKQERRVIIPEDVSYEVLKKRLHDCLGDSIMEPFLSAKAIACDWSKAIPLKDVNMTVDEALAHYPEARRALVQIFGNRCE